MKKITRSLLAIFSITLLSLSITSPSFAVSTEVNFDMTQLAEGVPTGSLMTTTELAPSGDWTTTNTSTNSSSDNQTDQIGYGLKIPTEDIAQCSNGELPFVVGYKSVLVTKNASPNVKNPNSVHISVILTGATDETIDDINSTFDSSDSAPEDTLNGTFTMTSYYKNPMTVDVFNSSENTFIGIVDHFTQEGSFTVTTEKPVFVAVLNCDATANQGQETGGSGADTSALDDANSPKTGAGEVLLGTFLVALVASSFVVYKAIEKHRNTAKLSEK